MRCGQRGCIAQPDAQELELCPTCGHPLLLIPEPGDGSPDDAEPDDAEPDNVPGA